ncbi:DVU_1556 family methyltransferase [Pseudodesulfovibrio sp.]|uniref:DVU_1556 family methyltransferase n=1 Tax=unclassified Pseudodesulfovibrio TaxID=2661612 RepID=UPI003B00F83A
MEAVTAPLWERPGLRHAAGDTLRPGGFELTDRAAEFIGLTPGVRVLDVGSGLGATVARLRARYGADAWGVEPSCVQVERAFGPAHLIRGQGDVLPFRSNVFQAVFCECVLSLLPNPAAGLAEFGRVLASSGYLVLTDLCQREGGRCGCGTAASTVTGGASCADRAVPVADTLELVAEHGFDVVLVEDHDRYLRDLAARLILAGEPAAACGRGLGYYLLIARKRGENRAG